MRSIEARARTTPSDRLELSNQDGKEHRLKLAIPLCAVAAIAVASCREVEPTAAGVFSAPQSARRSLNPGCTNVVALPDSGDLGLNVHGFASLNASDDPLRQQYLQILKNSKVGWARVDVEWSSIQRDGPTTWDWGDVDSTMARAYCAGVNLLGTLTYTPYWASSNKGATDWDYYSPSDSTAWINFVRTVVNRYPWVHYWSIWNEPNSTTFYEGSANDYVALVRWASPAIHGNPDGQQRFLVGGEFGWDTNTVAWADTLLEQQGSNVDILSVHPLRAALRQRDHRDRKSSECRLSRQGGVGHRDECDGLSR